MTVVSLLELAGDILGVSKGLVDSLPAGKAGVSSELSSSDVVSEPSSSSAATASRDLSNSGQGTSFL